MPNIASALKAEIARVARKEIRAEVAGLKSAVVRYRSEIATLKRRTQALEQQLRRVARARKDAAPRVEDTQERVTRFSAKGFASQRRRLGLSAAECGALLGASAQSIYNWEEGKARPRAQHVASIVMLRSMGKKDARSRLDSLKAE